MKNTRQKILDKARKLFNDLGYSQVTIRMIAIELNMSSGNLNYHFRKREDILEALYFEMVEPFDKRVALLDDQHITLDLMKTDIQSSMKRMIEYRFFWSDLYYLLRSNKKMKAHFTAVKEKRIGGYKYVFDVFLNANILKKSSFENEYNLLIDRMIDYSNTWLYASILYDKNHNEDELIENASCQLLSLLYPYLTNSGQEVFKSLFKPVLVSN